jgi:deoxyadenosine/deoxycytidine kinase
VPKKRFLVIAGNIGCGKSTLTAKLAKHYQWEPHFESVSDNPYLPDFYRDMPRWSLPLQIFFLSKRYQAHQGIIESLQSAIQDRCIYEDSHIFARALFESGKMDQRDYENYQALYRTVATRLKAPDLVLYIRRPVSQLIDRIRERGREYEQAIPTPYLELLDRCYEDWISGYDLGRLLVVNSENLDFKNNPDHFAHLCEQIDGSCPDPGQW